MSRIQPAESPPSIQKMLAVATFRKFPKRTMILQQGSISESVFYILSGSVAVEKYDESGQKLIFSYLSPGAFFGELGLFDDRPHRSATVVARSDTEIAVVSYAQFRDLVAEDPDLLYALAQQLANRLRDTSIKLSNLAFLDVTGRIAKTLLELASDDTEGITHPDGMMIKITREELGRLVNCSRELAGQVLYALEEQGLIHMEGRSIVVHRE